MDEQTPFEQPTFSSSFQPEIFPVWEDANRPAFERWWETVKSAITGPVEFFSRMNTNGGLGSPLTFGVIGGSIGAIIAQLFNLLLQVAGFSVLAFLPTEARSQASAPVAGELVGNIGGGICAMVLMPVFVAIGLFIGSGITHLFLMLVGGAKKPYEATFRVDSYITGSWGLIQAIPICGSLIYFPLFIVVKIIGISKAHEISTGKAALAVLLPVALVCTCCALAFGGIFGAAFFAELAKQQH